MKYTPTQRRMASLVLVVALFAYSFAPLALTAKTIHIPLPKMVNNAPVSKPISVVEKIALTKTILSSKSPADILQINWDQKFKLDGKEVTYQSEEGLSTLALSNEIKDIIRLYRKDKKEIDDTFLMLPSTKKNKKQILNEGLKFTLTKKLIGEGNQSDLPTTIVKYDNNSKIKFKKSKVNDQQKAVLKSITPVKVSDNFFQKSFKNIVGLIFPSQIFASNASTTEYLINYLKASQNIDGSWGSATSTKFIVTSAVVDALQTQGITGTTTNRGVEWVSYYLTDNADYLAEKTAIALHAGEATSTAQSLLNSLNEEDGGFAFNRGYQSDVLTTAKVLKALTSASYTDYGSNPHLTFDTILYYLLHKQRYDKGWSAVSDQVSTLKTTAEVVESLNSVKPLVPSSGPLNSALATGLSYLSTSQLSNGSWNNNILDTASAYYALNISHLAPTYGSSTLNYFENSILPNGSVANDPYQTAKVLKALSVSSSQNSVGNVAITNITTTSILRTNDNFTLSFTVENKGDASVNRGVFHIMADNYDYWAIDFASNGVVIPAHTSINIALEIDGRFFVGNVPFTLFVESTDGIIYPQSRFTKSFTFAPDQTNTAAMPMYYTAYKSVSGANTPAITWKWINKPDPNRGLYAVFFKPLGAANWEASFGVASNSSEITLYGPFVSGQTYEVSFGAANLNGEIYSLDQITQVKVSSSPSQYSAGSLSGIIKSTEGVVGNVKVSGSTGSLIATSTNEGAYALQAIPWGSGIANVSDFRYENYTKRFTVIDNSLTNVTLYTDKKVDTALPVVSNLFIVGESDKVMENQEKKLIQYSVNDDIGSNGVGIVKSVTFSYFDPHDVLWHIIGSEEGFLSGTRTFEWVIPSNLLGTGYKLKAVARDFAGKDSVPVEWGGEFEITQGNASPTFSFTAPTLLSTATADANYTIKWIDADPDDNATILLSYDTDNNPSNNNHTLITSVSEDDIQNEYIWDTRNIATSTQFIRADIFDGHNATNTIYSNRAISITHLTAPDFISPTISIVGLTADNFTVNGDGKYIMGPIIKVDAKATDNSAISNVKFYLKVIASSSLPILVDTDTSSPYSALIQTSAYPNNNYYIQAVAKDTSGNYATTTLTNYPLTFAN